MIFHYIQDTKYIADVLPTFCSVLHDNLIPTLYNETFVQSPLLTQLWLYNNEISCLEADTFKGLPRVQIM